MQLRAREHRNIGTGWGRLPPTASAFFRSCRSRALRSRTDSSDSLIFEIDQIEPSIMSVDLESSTSLHPLRRIIQEENWDLVLG